MVSSRPDLAVSGVPETMLSDATLSRLPGNLAPAPWDVTCSAMLWGCRGGDAAIDALPPALRKSAKALAVVGGMIRYQSTPVGAYDEVFAVVVTRQGYWPVGTVAFMAVDGDDTLVGGRVNWAMPKAPARFAGDPLRGMAASGIDRTWRVQATARPLGPALPSFARGNIVQEFPDGATRSALLSGRFRMRPAMITVEVESESTLPDWFRPGRHLGAVLPQVTGSLGVSARE